MKFTRRCLVKKRLGDERKYLKYTQEIIWNTEETQGDWYISYNCLIDCFACGSHSNSLQP